jgi:hypothetical protein
MQVAQPLSCRRRHCRASSRGLQGLRRSTLSDQWRCFLVALTRSCLSLLAQPQYSPGQAMPSCPHPSWLRALSGTVSRGKAKMRMWARCHTRVLYGQPFPCLPRGGLRCSFTECDRGNVVTTFTVPCPPPVQSSALPDCQRSDLMALAMQDQELQGGRLENPVQAPKTSTMGQQFAHPLPSGAGTI